MVGPAENQCERNREQEKRRACEPTILRQKWRRAALWCLHDLWSCTTSLPVWAFLLLSNARWHQAPMCPGASMPLPNPPTPTPEGGMIPVKVTPLTPKALLAQPLLRCSQSLGLIFPSHHFLSCPSASCVPNSWLALVWTLSHKWAVWDLFFPKLSWFLLRHSILS